MTIGSGHASCWGRNGEFSVRIGPITSTADILGSSIKGAGCSMSLLCLLAQKHIAGAAM